jgi:hypothetical protein
MRKLVMDTPISNSTTEYDRTTAALEPLVVEMGKKIDAAVKARNLALAAAAVMRVVSA